MKNLKTHTRGLISPGFMKFLEGESHLKRIGAFELLLFVVQHGLWDRFRRIVDEGEVKEYIFSEMDSHGRTLLHYAAMVGNIRIVRTLLERRADPNRWQYDRDPNAARNPDTPMMLAAKYGTAAVMRLLIAHGGKVTGTGDEQWWTETPLNQACKEGNLPVVREMLKHLPEFGQADPKDHGVEAQALSAALCSGKRSIVNTILTAVEDRKKLVNTRVAGFAQIQMACSRCSPWQVKMLLGYGAEVNVQERQFHRYPIHNLLHGKKGDGLEESKCFAIVKMLLDAGHDKDATTNSSETILQWASQCGYLSIVRLLVEGGAKFNKGNSHSHTAASLATCHGQSHVLEYLLEKEVNPNAVIQSDSLLGWARHHCSISGDNSCVTVLRAYSVTNEPVRATG